jgi:bacteriorhodopsin
MLKSLLIGAVAVASAEKPISEPELLKGIQQLRDEPPHGAELGSAVAYARNHPGEAMGVAGDYLTAHPRLNAAAQTYAYNHPADVKTAINYLGSGGGNHGFLNPHDVVAISFWIISIAMVASTVFFLMESMTIANNWKTSLNVGALVTLIAAVHYFYMREYWVIIHHSPIVYRYIDWSLTVPLQMIEFYLILSAVNPNLGSGMFWRLLLGTVAMLSFGYLGESFLLPAWWGFIGGMCGWAFILNEIFFGEAGSCAQKDNVSVYVKSAFQTCRFIVTVGWSIYPLGYFFGFLLGSVDESALNLVYNLADFVNKIAFCLAIWHAAKSETKAKGLA